MNSRHQQTDNKSSRLCRSDCKSDGLRITADKIRQKREYYGNTSAGLILGMVGSCALVLLISILASAAAVTA